MSAKKGDEAIEYQAKAVLVSTGVHPRKLGVPGEDEYRGKRRDLLYDLRWAFFSRKNHGDDRRRQFGSGIGADDVGDCQKVFVLTTNPEMKGEKALIDNLKK